jgi:hypothetical protein
MPRPDVKLPVPVRTVAPIDRKHYSVSTLVQWTNPPDTCPAESAADETSATRAGDVSIVSLPLADRVKLASMAEAAHAQADALEMTLDPATYDQLMYLFQTRVGLIATDANLKAGREAAQILVGKAVSIARHAPFPTVAPVFLTQAIFQTPGLFPLTD